MPDSYFGKNRIRVRTAGRVKRHRERRRHEGREKAGSDACERRPADGTMTARPRGAGLAGAPRDALASLGRGAAGGEPGRLLRPGHVHGLRAPVRAPWRRPRHRAARRESPVLPHRPRCPARPSRPTHRRGDPLDPGRRPARARGCAGADGDRRDRHRRGPVPGRAGVHRLHRPSALQPLARSAGHARRRPVRLHPGVGYRGPRPLRPCRPARPDRDALGLRRSVGAGTGQRTARLSAHRPNPARLSSRGPPAGRHHGAGRVHAPPGPWCSAGWSTASARPSTVRKGGTIRG